MPIGAVNYRQTATYWGAPTQGGFGDITFGDPIAIRCRWEQRVEEFVNSEGSESFSRAIVWTYDSLEIGGYLVLGDQTGEADPTQLDDALPIQRVDDIPDLRGLNHERKNYL